jgi:hypothetical protein
MTDVRKLLERQAAWQKSRASLPWPDKVRIAERVRASVVRLRLAQPDASGPARESSPAPPASPPPEASSPAGPDSARRRP